jgi:outer membrane protein OmpA-like peptidoglycan-associated protein
MPDHRIGGVSFRLSLGGLLMVEEVPMTRRGLVLGTALALSLTGCATRQFVRTEIAGSEATLKPAVEQLADGLRVYQTEVQELAVQTAEVRQAGEEATRAAIEALGMADVAAGHAADAIEHAAAARGSADDAVAAGQRARDAVEGTAERLTRLWRGRTRPSVVEETVLRFRVDAWVPDDRARATLRDIARRLRENPGLVVELEGYADSAGAPLDNLRLSQLRAEAVGRFLAEEGVETHRLQTIGLGTARPVADNATAEGRRQNRRVVLRLLDPS